MKILLTGGNGFLGSCVHNTLSEKHDVYTLSRKNSDFNYNLEFQIPMHLDKFDLVIHAAGKAHTIPKNEFQSLKFYKINVLGTINLLKGLENFYIPKQFVFISSVSVYGLIEGCNITENTHLLAKDPYGKSKIDAENIIIKWCKENNVICTILRLPLLVGANPPGNLGTMIRGIKKGYYFNIAGGKARKSMVLASDIAKYILKASDVGGVYNLTDSIHTNLHDLSFNIAKQLGKSYVPNLSYFIAFFFAKIGDFFGNSFPINSKKLSKITSTLTFDDTKARQSFGWNPTPVLKGIDAIILNKK